MNKPTNRELELAREVIEWIIEYTEKNEPYAISFIAAGNEFIQAMPMNQEEISDEPS